MAEQGPVSARPVRGPAGSAALGTLVAVRRARDHIDRHYAEPLELDQIAAAAGYSRFHFVRAFRAAYGETPGRYLTRRRVERAQELLRTSELTVTEICHQVGFTSLGSFSSLFNELVGTPPSGFRRAARSEGPLPIPACFVLMKGGPSPASSGAFSSTAMPEKPRHGSSA